MFNGNPGHVVVAAKIPDSLDVVLAFGSAEVVGHPGVHYDGQHICPGSTDGFIKTFENGTMENGEGGELARKLCNGLEPFDTTTLLGPNAGGEPQNIVGVLEAERRRVNTNTFGNDGQLVAAINTQHVLAHESHWVAVIDGTYLVVVEIKVESRRSSHVD
jgi:hypothetical protein